jgi:hypothetical protein
MGFHEKVTPEQRKLIEASQVFFVASVAPDLSPGPGGEGAVNVSPKGGTQLHVVDDFRVAYLDYPGSGNETARHAMARGPVTVMVTSFEARDPAIVRLYGYARVYPVDDSPVSKLVAAHEAENLGGQPRQVVEIAVERTQTSCGYGVPVFEFSGQRPPESRGRRYK